MNPSLQETTLAEDIGLAATGRESRALDPLKQHRGSATGYDAGKVSIAQQAEQVLGPVGCGGVVESHTFEDMLIGESELPGGTRSER
jgi:hypothetical protein